MAKNEQPIPEPNRLTIAVLRDASPAAINLQVQDQGWNRCKNWEIRVPKGKRQVEDETWLWGLLVAPWTGAKRRIRRKTRPAAMACGRSRSRWVPILRRYGPRRCGGRAPALASRMTKRRVLIVGNGSSSNEGGEHTVVMIRRRNRVGSKIEVQIQMLNWLVLLYISIFSYSYRRIRILSEECTHFAKGN